MNREQKEQLLLILSALERDFYHPLEEISFFACSVDEWLPWEQAVKRPRRAIRPGDAWGGSWDYLWLFSSFTLPEEAKGERIVMWLEPGGESTLYLNGKAFGTKRAEWVVEKHHHIVDQTITLCAVGGEAFDLALEVYGGTPLPDAPRGSCATGPVFPEDDRWMGQKQLATLGNSSFGIWNEDAYQLWLDVHMLWDLSQTLDEHSFWKERLEDALCQLLDELDLEQTLPLRRQAYRQARDFLKPLMEAKNGTYAPSMAVIGNAHLDVAWLWPLEETKRKIARTFAQQLRLLSEYKEARFLQSQAVLYDMCERYYPALFEEIRQAVARGQWIVDGAMWVEPDTNLAGGEALIRQVLYGKAYMKEKFGVDSRVAWLPDSFGYSAALPQILLGCGVTALTTQKIFWTYNDAQTFPYHYFMWRGLDQSTMPCYLHMQYESFVDVKTLCRRWADRVEKDGTGEFLLPFGYGDGGGGPTRDDMEQLRRQQNLQGAPKVHYESPERFFAMHRRRQMPVYHGELYFPCHRGTYTTQAAIKKGNRQCENWVRVWELWASMAQVQGGAEYPYAALDTAWKNLLLNQFHDILPGSAIAKVYEDARLLYRQTLSAMQDSSAKALPWLVDGAEEGVTFFHGLSQDTERLVCVPDCFADGAQTAEGEDILCSPTPNGVLALLTLPGMGQVSIRPKKVAPRRQVWLEETRDGYVMKNSVMTAVLAHDGTVKAITDAKHAQSRIGGVSNRFHLYRDVPRRYDAWDIDSTTFNRECPLAAESESYISCESELRVSVTFVHRFSKSTLMQTVSLDANSSLLRFETNADWHERHKLLKVSFHTGIVAEQAAHQIQFGHIMRPTHHSTEYDADRFEVCAHGFTAMYDATHGAALLNDCKYGVSTDGGTILLSLLRGATHPDPEADQGRHVWSYAYTFFDGAFSRSAVVYQAGELNTPLLCADGFSKAKRYFTLEDPCAVIETVKMSMDKSGDIIVRVYESMNGKRETILHSALPIVQAWECDMMEEAKSELKRRGDGLQLSLDPFEIKTLRLKLKR